MFDLILQRLKNKRILILGFGREGQSSLSFVQKYLPEAKMGIADKKTTGFESLAASGVNLHLGEDYLNAIPEYDIVIKTPGISLKDIDTQGVEITSQTDLFLSQFHAQTIGISGTKGKSTTTSIIYHLLQAAGHDAILTGNIGIPCFDIMEQIRPESIVVYELSAHQLEYVHNGPKVGVLLNVFEEHLDHFGTFVRYKAAKLNLLRFMQDDDVAVIHETILNEVAPWTMQKAIFSEKDFAVDEKKLPVHGAHNLLNVKAALCACEAYGVEATSLIPHLYSFTPLEHRLEKVGTFGGVTFYNDSISTIPQATIAACNTLGRVDFLLLGGFDRDIDYAPLADWLSEHPIPNLLFTGKAGARMMELVVNRGVQSNFMIYNSMKEAFTYLSAHAKQGDLCLLSPAASSYDQYKNFEARGAKFKTLARQFSLSLS